MRKILIVLTLFIGIGAVGGAIMMWVDPSGNGWGGAKSAICQMMSDCKIMAIFTLPVFGRH